MVWVISGPKYKVSTTVHTAYFIRLHIYFKQGGVYVLQIMDHYVAAWSLLMIGLCEVLAVTHAYGKYFDQFRTRSLFCCVVFSVLSSFKLASCMHC